MEFSFLIKRRREKVKHCSTSVKIICWCAVSYIQVYLRTQTHEQGHTNRKTTECSQAKFLVNNYKSYSLCSLVYIHNKSCVPNWAWKMQEYICLPMDKTVLGDSNIYFLLLFISLCISLLPTRTDVNFVILQNKYMAHSPVIELVCHHVVVFGITPH